MEILFKLAIIVIVAINSINSTHLLNKTSSSRPITDLANTTINDSTNNDSTSEGPTLEGGSGRRDSRHAEHGTPHLQTVKEETENLQSDHQGTAHLPAEDKDAPHQHHAGCEHLGEDLDDSVHWRSGAPRALHRRLLEGGCYGCVLEWIRRLVIQACFMFHQYSCMNYERGTVWSNTQK